MNISKEKDLIWIMLAILMAALYLTGDVSLIWLIFLIPFLSLILVIRDNKNTIKRQSKILDFSSSLLLFLLLSINIYMSNTGMNFVTNKYCLIISLFSITLYVFQKRWIRIIYINGLIIFLFFIVLVISNYVEITPINDLTLSNYLRQEYNLKWKFTEVDLEEINDTNLKLVHPDIRSLSGLEHMVNVETLVLSNDRINDYSPINSLEKLKKIVVYDIDLSKLDTLKSNDKVVELRIFNCTGKMSFIELFPNLKIVEFDSVNIDDEIKLQGMNNINTLRFSNIQQGNLSFISNSTNIEYIYIDKKSFLSLIGLEEFTHLKEIKIISHDNFNQQYFDNTEKLTEYNLELEEKLTKLFNLKTLEKIKVNFDISVELVETFKSKGIIIEHVVK